MATENSNSVGGELLLPGSEVNPGSPPAISKLGEDLLIEILILLPDPRSACRCKPVCKLWKSLISGPYFNRRFVSHHRSKNDDGDTPLLISSDHIEPIILSFLPVPEVVGEKHFHVFDSFKDLVLCGFRWFQSSGMFRTLVVCNPFTKQWFALPLMPAKSMVEHYTLVARLVCKPRSNLELHLGDDRVFVHREYRFRVVCIHKDERDGMLTKLDMFCFESGKWTKEALVFCYLDYPICFSEVTSHNGKLFWPSSYNYPILVVDAFQLDRPPIRVEVPHKFPTMSFDISVSQGALHAVHLGNRRTSRPLLTVWRQQEEDEDGRDQSDRVSWRKLYRVQLEEPSKSCDYDREYCSVVCLHPNQPHIVFLKKQTGENRVNISCYDVRTGEESLFAEFSYRWKAFQPRIFVWPTQIPNYDKLRVAYDGSYSCWVQRNEPAGSRQSTPPSVVSW